MSTLLLLASGQPARRDKTPDDVTFEPNQQDGGDGDSGLSTDSGGADSDEGGATNEATESCTWEAGFGLCFEFPDYDGTEDWCEKFQAIMEFS